MLLLYPDFKLQTPQIEKGDTKGPIAFASPFSIP